MHRRSHVERDKRRTRDGNGDAIGHAVIEYLQRTHAVVGSPTGVREKEATMSPQMFVADFPGDTRQGRQQRPTSHRMAERAVSQGFWSCVLAELVVCRPLLAPLTSVSWAVLRQYEGSIKATEHDEPCTIERFVRYLEK